MSHSIRQKAPWLAQTKFHVPNVRGDSIPRHRLITWLAESAVSTPITLISAPAGYGKTTLLASMQDSLKESRRIAWLTLDEEEDDLNAFLFALIGAFQLLAPRYGATTLDLLPLLVNSETPFTDSRLEARRLAGILINELTRKLRRASYIDSRRSSFHH